MEALSKEEKTVNTSATSPARRSRRQRHSATKGARLENNLLLATLAELPAGLYYEIHNLQVAGRWVAHIRLIDQMWTQDGKLKEGESCQQSQGKK